MYNKIVNLYYNQWDKIRYRQGLVIKLKEIEITKNEENQRLDRFLKKYLSDANTGFIFKMLRKKRIKLNGKKASPKDIIKEGDKLQLYLSDETINKFRGKSVNISDNLLTDLNVIYEDDNIVLINKPKGILSHSNSSEDKNTIVNQLITYLYQKGEYNPVKEKTFAPAICNRLDRNTSGIVIGAKNYNALQKINEAIRNGNIEKYYKTIVINRVKGNLELKGYLTKNEKTNKVTISQIETNGAKKIHTLIKALKTSEKYSLLEINLITGRTHQIRAHLASINHPVIGDYKYGNKEINNYFKKKYSLESQFLHAYKMVFNGLTGEIEYLNNKEFIVGLPKELQIIEKDIFK